MHNTPSKYQLICGMEVHIELKTKSKMFCGCKNDPFGAAEPNIYTCPVCLGMPGALPVPNKKAIEWTLKLGLALHCKINLFSKFDRKHYLYPELPKGYQISQYDIPFCYDGYIKTSQGRVGITRIHLEEDTGKLQHTTIQGEKVSLIDFNRSSVPLVEIVTEPDIHSGEQAKEYGKKLRDLVRYLDIADCDMEQGGMRLEANTSLQLSEVARTTPDLLPNYKVEVKNINSFRFLEQAIKFEADRQALILDKGETPTQETRGWNSLKSETFAQRSKESAEDYRYFPDPDIPPIHFTQAQIDALQAELPELPEIVIARWENEFGIEPRYSELLLSQTEYRAVWEGLFSTSKKDQLNTNQLASLIVNKKISLSLDTAILISAFKAQTTTTSIDESELAGVISSVIAENPNEVSLYKAGKINVLNFFIGQTMKKIGKKIDTALVKTELEKGLR